MILIRFIVCCFITILGPLSLAAAPDELTLPSRARLQADRVSPLDSYALPVGPFDAGAVPVRIFEGRIGRQSWRIDGAQATTLQVLAPLRDQLLKTGYDVVFECRETACGGFDFRFGIEVIPAPDMLVDIRNYRLLSATRGDEEALSLLISRAGRSAYIQVIHISSQEGEPLRIIPLSRPESDLESEVGSLVQQPDGLARELQTKGHVVLEDLAFATGAVKLNSGGFPSLEQLAETLRVNPGYRIALVGHTDSIGTLADNISLSKRRAVAVRARMIDQYGIVPARIEAEGMGYLAPVASNLTLAGRKKNRRVEVILLSQ